MPRHLKRSGDARCLLGLFLMAATTVLSGCGYALAGRGSSLPAEIRTIALPTLENRTSILGTEQVLTQKIQEEFIGRGKFKVVPDVALADAVLRGEILAITLSPVGLNEQQLASRYRIMVVIKAAFTDRKGVVQWSNDALTFQEEYDMAIRGTIDGATFVDQQRSAVQRLAADVARTMVTAIVEAF